MMLIRGIHNLRTEHCGYALTIGNFDGVHRGHQALLTKLRIEGSKYNAPVMVMLFEPHPLEVLRAKNAPARLTRLHEKLVYLKKAGVDAVLCIRFNYHFASYSARDFITELLVNKLRIKLLAVGDDFRFGAGRRGNFCLLEQASMHYSFNVLSTQTLLDNNQRISSTAIREALSVDDLRLAAMLLGRPFSMSGRVIYGDSLGRSIGFPTANIPLFRISTPITGVYVVYVKGAGLQVLLGVANIGIRPTLKRVQKQLEVHLLDITIDLYGQYIEVIFLHKIRDEKYFSSLLSLKEQIQRDVIDARSFFDHQKLN
ncbi:Bifunctional riboflavin kinase/FMN adenylyltransferase [Candidatus Erwinia haradaeae]|uniref:Riboflavin biosynthesis protein n=1 Tax=Candidatus Erwinia haradaeae TaxID=1922217 RepID=A0A451DCK2_9GAMM|nr:bifunctional riboflavin kinase/FAD synthetase [Candidatus Erwinia haradaeae]VFP84154.1 Bifunctional riboflavin kinase/FMN adenylyltransferase [Candidatus Erwinia haradaeae]